MQPNTVTRDEPLEIVAEELDEIRVYSAGCASSWSGFSGGSQDSKATAQTADWSLTHAGLIP